MRRICRWRIPMPVAAEESSKSWLNSGTTAKIKRTESKDINSKIKKSPEQPPKEMCATQKLKQQQKQEKHDMDMKLRNQELERREKAYNGYDN